MTIYEQLTERKNTERYTYNFRL